MQQHILDSGRILYHALQPALKAMSQAGLVLDLLIRLHQLDVAFVLARCHAGLRMVLDHGAMPKFTQ